MTIYINHKPMENKCKIDTCKARGTVDIFEHFNIWQKNKLNFQKE